MKEKLMMSSLFAATMADIATTSYGLSLGMREGGIMGEKLAEMENMNGAYIYKVATSAIIIGLYAFSKENPTRYAFSYDRAMRIVNIIAWGYAALNATRIVMANR